MSDHTDGPWYVEQDEQAGIQKWGIYGGKDGCVPVVSHFTAIEDINDARLIAAAPDLLEALELVKRRIQTCLLDEQDMQEGTMIRLLEDVSVAIDLSKGLTSS